jgi:hypothetical protein
MVSQFGDQYREYMLRTGMFSPRGWERIGARLPLPRKPAHRAMLGFLVLALVAVGGAFGLRAHTIARLPLWSEGRVTAMPILPGDAVMLEHRMTDVLELPEIKSRLTQSSEAILAYVVPPHYVMQGMIADTGPQWRLYEHHQTLAMIADWIFHPFRHLEGGHMMMHHDLDGAPMASPAADAVVRRLIFLRIDSTRPSPARASLFGINVTRTPRFFADVDIHNLAVVTIQPLGPGTGWGRVPTPMF